MLHRGTSKRDGALKKSGSTLSVRSSLPRFYWAKLQTRCAMPFRIPVSIPSERVAHNQP